MCFGLVTDLLWSLARFHFSISPDFGELDVLVLGEALMSWGKPKVISKSARGTPHRSARNNE